MHSTHTVVWAFTTSNGVEERRSVLIAEMIRRLVIVTLVLLCVHAVISRIFAQERGLGQNPRAFEVVSVKRSGLDKSFNPGKSYRPFRYSPGKVTCNLPLESILREAYAVKRWQIIGPGWIDHEYFELTATMPWRTTLDTARLMLRTVLADRLGLKLHLEQRQTPVYTLTVGKDGPKLAEVERQKTFVSESEPGHWSIQAISAQGLVERLNWITDHPVIDQTGLRAFYKIDLKWTQIGRALCR